MGLETGTYISDLNANNPVNATDVVGAGDDHLRLIKSTILNTFPNLTGAMTRTQGQLNNTLVKNEAGNIISAGNTPGTPTLALETTRPVLVWDDGDAAVDEGRFYAHSSAGQWALVAINDANNSSETAILVDRTATSVDSVSLHAGGIKSLDVVGGGLVDARAVDAGNTSDTRFRLVKSDNGVKAGLGFYSGTDDLWIRNQIHGANVILAAEDAGGTVRNLFKGDPDGTTIMYSDGAEVLVASTGGAACLRSVGNTDTENRRLMLQHQNGAARGYLGYVSSGTLVLGNQVHGSPVSISGENASGVAKTLFNADPDGGGSIYYAGSAKATTQNTGIELQGSLNNTSGGLVDTYLTLSTSTASDRGYVGFLSSAELEVRNLNISGGIRLASYDAGSSYRTQFLGDPDGDTLIRGDTTISLQVAAGGVEAVEIQTDGGIVTPNTYADEFGFKGAPRETQNGSYTLVLTDAGKMIYKSSGGAGETITVPPNSSVAFATGTIIVVANDGGGDLTIAQGAGVTIEQWNGSTGNKTLPDNNKAILEKVDTDTWKYSATA